MDTFVKTSPFWGMQDRLRTPWKPDPRWADPLIGLFALLSLLLLFMAGLQGARPRPPQQGPGMEGRLQEVAATLTERAGRPVNPTPFQALPNPWDRALGAVLLADAGRLREAQALLPPALPGPHASAFRAVFEAAYAQGPLPSPDTRRAVADHLRQGPAALRLEAALDQRQWGRVDRGAVEAWTRGALLWAAGVGGMVLLGLLGALVYVGFLAATRAQTRPALPDSPVDGRALALVLLGWFVAMHASGVIVGGLTAFLPLLRPFVLPLQYAGHATVGLLLLCRAEGRDLRGLLAALTPATPRGSLGHALGGFALAVPLVLLLGALLAPVMPKDAAPQQDLVDLLQRTRGLLPTVLIALTLAGAAPFFEELLFRGTLLRWIQARLPGRRGTAAAVLGSGLLFGAIHLQPLAMPTLTTLGLVLGAVFLRARSIWAAIGLHALWNGSVFLLQRVLG